MLPVKCDLEKADQETDTEVKVQGSCGERLPEKSAVEFEDAKMQRCKDAKQHSCLILPDKPYSRQPRNALSLMPNHLKFNFAYSAIRSMSQIGKPQNTFWRDGP